MADDVIQLHPFVIDRPAGSSYPRYPEVIYPLDYGYLYGTAALDGDGVDCWVGSLPTRNLTGVIITIDTFKSDTELKWQLGCTSAEMELALDTHQHDLQAALLIRRQDADSGES